MIKGKLSDRWTVVSLVVIAALCYYACLAAKTWTWVFVSGDSGDWLAASTIWMAPQPYGSPLYILLGHLLHAFSPESLVWTMTLFLSVIPAAITVGTVYLIIRELGLNKWFALLGAGVLLGCGVFLSQATVLEEYSLATMFVTLAFYFHLRKQWKLTALMLGLGTAVHVIVAAITFLWVCTNWREWKQAWKPMAGIYILAGVLPYSLILVLMALDTPRLVAGNLTLSSLNAYLGSTGTIGAISLVETPRRLLEAGEVILLSFGVSLIPMVKGLQRPWGRFAVPAIVLIGFCLWLYITDSDETTWTFLTFCLPIASVAVAVGVSRLPRWVFAATGICTLSLISVNAVYLNADRLTREQDRAMSYYTAMMELPAGAYMALPSGGPYGLGAIYVMTQREDLTSIFLQKQEGWDNQDYRDYIQWVSSHRGLEGENWVEQIDYCLDNGKPVFIGYAIQPPEWQEVINERYELKEYNGFFKEIVSRK